MSRYEQKAENKNVLIITGVVVIILIALGFWLIENNKNDGVINQEVEIPKEKINNDIKLDKLIDSGSGESSDFDSENNTDEELEVSAKKLNLVELEESDAVFEEAVMDVSKNLANWFDVKDVISKYIILIHDISQNQMLAKNRRFLQLPQKNIVQEDSQGLYLTEEGYKRYDYFADAIDSIDVSKGLDLYFSFKPLFNKVYEKFSYPAEYKVDDIFLKAAANVIKAPKVEGRVGVLKHSLLYKFSDEKLEALSDVEKQMLRMGPENTEKIQAKLRQLVEKIAAANE